MKPYRFALLALGSLSLLFTPVTWSTTAIVLPGLHEQGVDLQDAPVSAAAALEWELDNADVVFGAYENKSDNERVNAIGYMYNQKLELNSGWLENDIRNQAEISNIDYEGFFLHFSEDTILAEVDSSHGENTLLNRKPMIVGYTASADHAGFWLYQPPPWDADVFGQTNNGGALYVYHSEKFDRLTLTFSQFAQGGNFIIEYPPIAEPFWLAGAMRDTRAGIVASKKLKATKYNSIQTAMPTTLLAHIDILNILTIKTITEPIKACFSFSFLIATIITGTIKKNAKNKTGI